jgi:hypothetical protein
MLSTLRSNRQDSTADMTGSQRQFRSRALLGHGREDKTRSDAPRCSLLLDGVWNRLSITMAADS